MASDELNREEASLVANPSRRNHTRDIHILSSAFLLVFLAFGAVQNLETTVNAEGGLGTISLGILYVSFMIFSLFASAVVRLLGPKRALIVGTTGYWLFLAANLFPSWFTMVPASLYLGFAAAILWVGQGTYLTSTGRSHARLKRLNEGTVIGQFNGEFWGMFAAHQFVGNLVSLALLSDKKDGSTKNTNLLFSVFLCSMTVGTILMCFLSEGDGRQEEVTAVDNVTNSRTSLKSSVVNLLLDVRMILIIPLIAYSGLQQAFVWAEYTMYIVKPALGVAGVGGAMAIYGATDALCSIVSGRLTSGLTSLTWITSFGCLVHGLVFVWILLSGSTTAGVLGKAYPLVTGGLLGIGDGVLNTQIYALLALLFKHDTEGAFAQFKLWQSASIALVFFINTYISLYGMTVIMLVGLVISVAGFLILIFCVEEAFSSSPRRGL